MIDAVMERHGVTHVGDTWCAVRETYESVYISVYDGTAVRGVNLTPSEARYIASKLRRLARRVEEKNSA